VPTSLSACLIVRDEEERLGDALASVAFCDEIVVVDGGSRDRTRDIASAAGARVIENAWRGYGAQRNVAIDAAGGEWVLEIDADERVTPELRASIERFVAAPAPGYEIAAMPIRHVFLGRPLGPAARYPDYRHRLFRRGVYRHDESRTVHEGLVPRGPVWPLQGDLLHLLADSFGEAVGDAGRYARLEAAAFEPDRSAVAVATGVVFRPLAKLTGRTTVLGGWRDGWRGLAKIGLDSATDALVWLHALRAQPRAAPGARGHYSAPMPAAGPPRVVGISSPDQLERATAWLGDARAAGADVVLVSSGAARAGDIRVRRLRHLTPLRALAALEAEWQLRPYDSLVAFGPRAESVAAFLPRRLRGRCRRIDERTPPREALALLSPVEPVLPLEA
jgi:hypothetical protein